MRLSPIHQRQFPRLNALLQDIGPFVLNDSHIRQTIDDWTGNSSDKPVQQGFNPMQEILTYGFGPLVNPIMPYTRVVNSNFTFSIVEATIDSSEYKMMESLADRTISIEYYITAKFEYIAHEKTTFIYDTALWITTILLHECVHGLRWNNRVGQKFHQYNNTYKLPGETLEQAKLRVHQLEEQYTSRCMELAFKNNGIATLEQVSKITGFYRHYFKNLKAYLEKEEHG